MQYEVITLLFAIVVILMFLFFFVKDIRTEEFFIVFYTTVSGDSDYYIEESIEDARNLYNDLITSDEIHCAGIGPVVKGTDW